MKRLIAAALVAGLLVAIPAVADAASPPSGLRITGVQRSARVRPSGFAGSVRLLPDYDPRGRRKVEDDRTEEPAKPPPTTDFSVPSGRAAAPGDAGESTVTGPLQSFEGIDNALAGFAPPDSVGDVGPNHFVEATNATAVQIFSKSGATLAGPFNMNSLWPGDAGPSTDPANLCHNRNDGDPVVLYDQYADRWILAQFATANPYAMCIAVSKTPDPVAGGWNAYAYAMSDFPDYEKFGVWRDGLYMTTFEDDHLGVFRFDRDKMLAGAPSDYVKFDVASDDQPRGTRILPADAEGTLLPPKGEPEHLAVDVDGELTSTAGDVDRVEVYDFAYDAATPSSSTLSLAQTLPTAPIDNTMCYTTVAFPYRNCIPQQGTSTALDPLSHRAMFRLSYRNFDGVETMVLNQTVDADSTDHAGIRWFELRRTDTSTWGIRNQGTFAPDAAHRWMGSVAVNAAGDVGVGYSESSPLMHPSLAFSGRTATDPPGQLDAEQRLQTGADAFARSNSRWGDYSTLTVDPTDDCTFWFVGEYGDQHTHIGSFKVSPSCAPPTTTIAGGPTGTTTDATPSFAVSGTGATLECAVDAGAFAPCSTPFTTPTLADGSHTIAVRARQAGGQLDPSPEQRTFTVDTAAPDTAITDGPGAVTNATSAGLGLASEPGARFECRLDGGAFSACASPATLSGLGDGAHTFQARAIDAAGNADPTPATRSWTVDTVAPDTSITSGPPGLTRDRTAAIAFAGAGVAGFECRVDAGAFAPCTSPARLSALPDGSHAFAVRAKDAAGNADATPATRQWRVDTVAPSVVLGRAVRRGRRTTLKAPITCPAGEPCAGTLMIRGGRARGSKRFSVPAGARATLAVRMSRRVARRARVTLLATVSDAAGNQGQVKRRARVR